MLILCWNFMLHRVWWDQREFLKFFDQSKSFKRQVEVNSQHHQINKSLKIPQVASWAAHRLKIIRTITGLSSSPWYLRELFSLSLSLCWTCWNVLTEDWEMKLYNQDKYLKFKPSPHAEAIKSMLHTQFSRKMSKGWRMLNLKCQKVTHIWHARKLGQGYHSCLLID